MWLGKFLDLREDIPKRIKDKISKNLERKKLTPLEFTILESIFNVRQISGYDLIDYLNKHFAGTWKARSGTIYPILSKLKRKDLLDSKTVKSPIGPLRKIYFLTDAGKEIVKTKVNKNFQEQMTFMKNFLIELSNIYIQSFPEKDQETVLVEVQKLVRNTLEEVINGIEIKESLIKECPACKAEIEIEESNFCSRCGAKLDSSGV
ncbi:MAG: helix-turn-helix transcriptional regulator [Promethearchaeota archaeon]